MSELYYIPTIEEFHAGFEYEWAGKEMQFSFEKRIYSIELYLNELEGSIPSAIRVKYLDTEDIEELGWKKTVWDEESLTADKGKATLSVMFKDHFVRIHNVTESASTNIEYITCYQGYCKNKNELHKLMQQLNIQ